MKILKILFIILIFSNVGIAQRTVRDQMKLAGSSPDSSGTYFFNIPENEDFDYFLGVVKATSSLPSGVLDNEYFQIRNDSLLTKYSFDYEGFTANPLQVAISSPAGMDTAVVSITDINGKWDTDGIADADLAKKYPSVNQGDYIVWNYSSGMDLSVTPPNLGPGQKVLIHGKKYGSLNIDMQNGSGSGPSGRVIITNFLGQVYTKNGIELSNTTFVRITGQYSNVAKTGHRYFVGCDKDSNSVSFGFSHGTYGIFQDNRWQSDTIGSGLLINSNNTGVEIDHIEIANGGFNGINIGWKDNYSVASSTYIHHNFIHDIGSEGILLGVPLGFPQQVFQNTLIENNAIVRCGGDCIQTTWISTGSIIRNNFMHGALDWKSPFARWQDGILEFSSLGGDIEVLNNIIMGGGSATVNISTRKNVTPLSYSSDTVAFRNNLLYQNRSNNCFYVHSTSDNKTHILFDANYMGRQGFDLDEVYPAGDTNNNKAFGLNNTAVSTVVSNNTYDNSFEVLNAGQASPILANNKKLGIPLPEFDEYFGKPAGFNYLKINRYTDIIGADPKFPNSGTNKGNAASWKLGDIVQTFNNQGETRFYECIQATNNPGDQPPMDDTNNANWQLLSWAKPGGAISYFPPDNITMKSNNYYATQRNMGPSNSISNNPPPPPPPVPNVPPVVSISDPVDLDKRYLNDTINIDVTATDPDGAIFSVRIVLNGQTLKRDLVSPYSASFVANTTGKYEIYATAYDSDADSTVSDTVSITVVNPNSFNVLNFTKTSGTDHGTSSASQSMLNDLGSQYGFTVDQDSTGISFNSLSNLQNYDVILFTNTTGNALLNSTQRSIFETYMLNGGAAIGIHGAADAYRHSTANGANTGIWDWYSELFGASMKDSPKESSSSTSGALNIVNSHPTVDFLPSTWNFVSAFPYWEGGYFDSTVIPVLEVQQTGAQSYDQSRTMAWYRFIPGGGKVFYTGLGHNPGEYLNNQDFRKHILEAILWAEGNTPPIVDITSVTPGDTVIKDSVVTFHATASDPDGRVDSVSFHLNNQILGWDYTAPYFINYTAKNIGKKTIYATAYDDEGASARSASIIFHVNDTISGDTIILTGNTINENYPAGTYIGTLSGSNSYRIDHEYYDGWFFDVKGDSLISRMSFNYDAFLNSRLSNTHPKVQVLSAAGNKAVFDITIIPASGKYDQDGYADQDLVNFYKALGDSSLMVGDYVIFNWSNKTGKVYGVAPNLSYPNQIKVISGYYTSLGFDLDNAVGNNTKQPVIITNWLGQVEVKEGIGLNKCNTCRLTGEYDAKKRTGHYMFDVSIHEPWKYRRYGIFRDIREAGTKSAITVRGGGMTKIEIDHLELMGGGYDAINFKDDNVGGGIVDSCRVHDLYCHDIKGEGLYMGNTKEISTHGPQQHFKNVIVQNNLFIRCGNEGYQFQRGIGNNVYRNNVIWSGMNWLMPFQNNQNGNQQMAWANGGHLHRDEIFMGAAKSAMIVKPRANEVPSYSADTNYILNSLYYSFHGNGGRYLNGGGTDASFSPLKIDSLYVGRTGNNFEIINRNYDPTKKANVIFIENWKSPITIGSLFYDNTVENNGNQNQLVTNPVQQVIPEPQFENAFGVNDLKPGMPTASLRPDSIHRWHRWTDCIWCNTSNNQYLYTIGFNVGSPMMFEVGDVVRDFTPIPSRWDQGASPIRLYYCIQPHNSQNVDPGVSPGWENYWVLLEWIKPNGEPTFYPPDDWDLAPGSYYEQRGMGLR
jgi:hypothetical protein